VRRDPAPGDYPPERQRPARSRVNGRVVWNSTASAAPRGHVAHLAKRSARVASVGHRRGNDGSHRLRRRVASGWPLRNGAQARGPATRAGGGRRPRARPRRTAGTTADPQVPPSGTRGVAGAPQRLTHSAASAGGKCRSWLWRGHDEMSSTAIGRSASAIDLPRLCKVVGPRPLGAVIVYATRREGRAATCPAKGTAHRGARARPFPPTVSCCGPPGPCREHIVAMPMSVRHGPGHRKSSVLS
jgi:hypothetical protein